MPRTRTGSNITQVKSHNRQAILQTLLQTPLSRVELAKKLAISTMTASNLVRELENEGLITARHVEPKSVGRPRITLQINPKAGYAIGVQLGIGHYWVTLANLHGQLVYKKEGAFPQYSSATAVLDQIATDIAAVQVDASQQNRSILGIGFGASGLVDTEQGINLHAPSLGWHNIPIKQILEDRLGLPVAVENNVRAMALAEAYFGAGQTANSLAFVFGRVGVGAGLVLNGQLYPGHHMGAGEIGHTIIMPHGGQLCRCGQQGCLETLVSQPALIGRVKALGDTTPPIDIANTQEEVAIYDQILTHARAGHPEITHLINEVGHYLSLALINLIHTVNPEIIFIGGMYAQGADLFLPILRQAINKQSFGRLGTQTKIEVTSFGLAAGTVGAACVALVHFFYRQQTKT